MKGWEVRKLHKNCKECSELVAAAIAHAESTPDTNRAASQYLSDDGKTVDHQAEVFRK